MVGSAEGRAVTFGRMLLKYDRVLTLLRLKQPLRLFGVKFTLDDWSKSVDRSGLFDPTWYLHRYPHVAEENCNPLLYYLLIGAFEGHDPSPRFDSKGYLERNPDIAANGINPLVHYIRHGAREGREGLRDDAAAGASKLTEAPLFQSDAERYDLALIAGVMERLPGDAGLRQHFHMVLRRKFSEQWSEASALARTGDYRTARLTMQAACQTVLAAMQPKSVAPRRPRIRKVALVANVDLPQCRLYRVEQKLEHLAAAGLTAQLFAYPKELQGYFGRAHEFDAVIFYRVPGEPNVVEAITLARQLGSHTFYEIDDLIFDDLNFPDTFGSYEGMITHDVYAGLVIGTALFRTAMSACDYAIASTTDLASYMAEIVRDRRTFLHRNAFSALHERLSREPPRPADTGEPVTIFYGSATKAHKSDFNDLVSPALVRLLQKHGERLRIVIVGYITLDSKLAAFSDRILLSDPIWDPESYWRALRCADINIAVLRRNPATDCKSEIKWMEAAMLSIPSVLSRTATYEEVVEDGQTALLAETPEQWFEALDSLVQDAEKRRRIGGNAHRAVVERYSVTTMAENISSMMSSVTTASLPTRRKKKILVVNVYYPPQAIGGATRVAHDNVLDITRKYGSEYDIEVFCTIEGEQHGYVQRSWSQDGIRVTGVTTAIDPDIDRKPRDTEMGRLFSEFLDISAPDLIHFHCIQRLTASVVEAARARAIPYIVTVHDGWWISDHQFLLDKSNELAVYDRTNPLNNIQRFGGRAHQRAEILGVALDGAAAILAVSEPFAGVYRAAGFPATRAVPNGVSRLPRVERQPSASGRVRLGYIGGLQPHKGHDLLREVVEAGHFPNLELLVINHARRSDYSETTTWGSTPVTFAGKLPQAKVGQLYASLDVLLAPSLWPESYGLVTREALACGLWVVASDRGAVGECVVDGENGFIISVDGPEGLAAALRTIDTDPARYLVSPARKVELRRSVDQADDLVRIYREIITETMPPPPKANDNPAASKPAGRADDDDVKRAETQRAETRC